jgi:hypothetical protein
MIIFCCYFCGSVCLCVGFSILNGDPDSFDYLTKISLGFGRSKIWTMDNGLGTRVILVLLLWN